MSNLITHKCLLAISLLVVSVLGPNCGAQNTTWALEAAGGGTQIGKGPRYSLGMNFIGMRTWDRIGVGAGIGLDFVNALRYDGTDKSDYSSDIILPIFARFQYNVTGRLFTAVNLGYSPNLKSSEIDFGEFWMYDRWSCKTRGIFCEPQAGITLCGGFHLALGVMLQRLRYLEGGVVSTTEYLTHKETFAPSVRLHAGISF